MRPALQALARQQCGLVTRRQCELAGYTQADLRAVTQKHGPWVIVWPSIYIERSAWDACDPGQKRLLTDRAAHMVMVTDHVMSHDSAARALGIPLLHPKRDLVHITREGVHGSRTEGGVKHHLTRCELGEIVDVGGMPVTGLTRTGLDVAREHGLPTGVVAIDYVRSLGAPMRGLRQELQTMKSWPKVRTVRRALELSDPRAESPAESLARLLLIEMGFEDIDVQWPVVASGHLYWVDLRVGCHVFEVDGMNKYVPPELGGLASVPAREALRSQHRRQAEVCAEGLGMSRLDWTDIFGRGKKDAMVRVRKEYDVTVARFGHQLPAHLAEQAERIRRTTPRRRSA